MIIQFFAVNGYKEHHLFTDIRNVVIILSILCGCLAQFYFKFPDNFWGIFGCIVGYGFFTLLAHCVEYFGMNGNTHIIILDSSLKENEKISQQHQKYTVGIKSDLKPFETDWNITFTSRIQPRYQYLATIDIRQCFDVNGEFVKRNYDKLLSKEFVQFIKVFNSKTD